jgi:hypothetical protein
LAKLGLPVVLLVIFLIKIGADHLEREGNYLKKGAAAEEKVSKMLTALLSNGKCRGPLPSFTIWHSLSKSPGRLEGWYSLHT